MRTPRAWRGVAARSLPQRKEGAPRTPAYGLWRPSTVTISLQLPRLQARRTKQVAPRPLTWQPEKPDFSPGLSCWPGGSCGGRVGPGAGPLPPLRGTRAPGDRGPSRHVRPRQLAGEAGREGCSLAVPPCAGRLGASTLPRVSPAFASGIPLAFREGGS